MRVSRLLPALALLATPAFAQCLTISLPDPGTNLQLTDDSLYVVSLPFQFPFAGQLYDRITIDSNGVVRLGDVSGIKASDFSPSTTEFRNDPFPAIALMWDDWNPALATSGNGVFYDADDFRASIVWKGVPQFGTGSGLLDGEIVLTPDGAIHLHYESTTTVQASGTAIVGITPGSGAPANAFDPFTATTLSNSTAYHEFIANGKGFELGGWSYALLPIDASTYSYGKAVLPVCPPRPKIIPELASGPDSFGIGCPAPAPGIFPMSHVSNTMVLGTVFEMQANLPDPASFFGLFVIGLSSPGIALDSYGMTNCTQYATDDISWFPVFFTPGSPMTLSIPVPFDQSLSMEVFTQGAAWTTLNPFGVITSNGLRHTIGL